MSALVDKIRGRGYWQVAIRPIRFIERRIPDISDLYPILQKTYVSLRGWSFPYLDTRSSGHIDIDWIGQEYEWQHHLSSWRFYQSGLFMHVSNMPIDWRDQSNIWPPDNQWKPGALIGIGDAIFSFTEIFEFAARLALSDASDEQMHIDITVGDLNKRILYVDLLHREPFEAGYQASVERFPYSVEPSRSDLVTNSKEFALEAANELFKRFGWKTTIDILRSLQDDMAQRFR